MKTMMGAAAILVFVMATEAPAQEQRYCYTPKGERYLTYAKRCPEYPGSTQPSKIRSCTLPDGSRAFGDRCPIHSLKTQQLDQTELSNRSSGADSRQNSERMLRFAAEEDRKLEMERRKDESQAAYEQRRLAAEEQRRQYEEQQRLSEEQSNNNRRRRR